MWLTSFASARVVFVQVMRQCVPASAHSDHNVTPQYLYKDDIIMHARRIEQQYNILVKRHKYIL